MSEEDSNGDRLKALVKQAAAVVVASEKKIGFRLAMELVGFEATEVSNAAIYKRVIRRAKGMAVVDEETIATPLAAVNVAPIDSTISSLTTATPPSQSVAMAVTEDVLATPVKEIKPRRTAKNSNAFMQRVMLTMNERSRR
jgi:hypothetical protein